MTNDDLRDQATAAAIGERLSPGQPFAHPSDPVSHFVSCVDDGQVHAIHSREFIHISFPASECFDPNTVVAIMIRMKERLCGARYIGSVEMEK